MNPPMTVIKMAHIIIIHFMQICYMATGMLANVKLTDVNHPRL